MKHYKEVEETTIEKKFTHKTCDRCGVIIPPLDIYDTDEFYVMVERVKLKLRFGKGYSYFDNETGG